jgi:flagellar basal-body rod protein FlgG
MIRSLYTAATGMNAQQLNMDVIANNLANVNTNGFKRSHANFQDLFYQTTRTAGSASGQGSQVATGVQVGLGTRTSSVDRIFTQGDFRNGGELNMVIQGDGFFQIQLGNGQVGFTRDGSFTKDAQGRLTTAEGFPVQPEINLQGAEGITVSQDGIVSGKVNNVVTRLGELTLARFANPSGLESLGSNLFRETTASGIAIPGPAGLNGMGTVRNGMVEMSNVKVVEEMVDMITAQRAYEVSSKSIQASDEMLQIANNLRR